MGGMGRSWEPGTPVIRVPGTGREDVACDPACLGVWIRTCCLSMHVSSAPFGPKRVRDGRSLCGVPGVSQGVPCSSPSFPGPALRGPGSPGCGVSAPRSVRPL